MRLSPVAARLALGPVLAAAAPALAADRDFEFWLNPSVSVGVADRTAIELETAQRFRDSSRGRPDTYFGRLWLNHRASDNIRLGFAVERRVNDGAANETRLIQQASGSWDMLRARLRLEQRFVDRADRTGLRVRSRLGVEVPLDGDGRWAAFADAEPFITIAATSRSGATGLTGLRTQVGVAWAASDRVEFSLGWLRQQDINRGRADTIGHAPIIGFEVGF